MVDVEPKGIEIDEIDQPINPETINNSEITKKIGKYFKKKSDDGKFYETSSELKQPYEAHFQQKYRIKSRILGREYPATAEGTKQMIEDEEAYGESQKKGE